MLLLPFAAIERARRHVLADAAEDYPGGYFADCFHGIHRRAFPRRAFALEPPCSILLSYPCRVVCISEVIRAQISPREQGRGEGRGHHSGLWGRR